MRRGLWVLGLIPLACNLDTSSPSGRSGAPMDGGGSVMDGRVDAAPDAAPPLGDASSLDGPSGDVRPRDDGGRLDGARFDASPGDAAAQDSGRLDGGRDGGNDAGSFDAGSADGAAADAAPIDAAPPSCDAVFNTAPEYILCSEDSLGCHFNVSLGNTMSCEDVCAGFGVACLGAFDNVNDAPCGKVAPDPCNMRRYTEICVCARPVP